MSAALFCWRREGEGEIEVEDAAEHHEQDFLVEKYIKDKIIFTHYERKHQNPRKR